MLPQLLTIGTHVTGDILIRNLYTCSDVMYMYV